MGSEVTLQTPWSSFCIARRLPPIVTAASFALGARSRNVIRRSAPTSGDRTAPPRPAPCPRPAGGCTPGAVCVGALWAAGGCESASAETEIIPAAATKRRTRNIVIAYILIARSFGRCRSRLDREDDPAIRRQG